MCWQDLETQSKQRGNRSGPAAHLESTIVREGILSRHLFLFSETWPAYFLRCLEKECTHWKPPRYKFISTVAKSQPHFFQSVGKIKSLVSQFPPNQDSCLWSSIFLWLFVDCPLLWDVLKVAQGESFGALLRTYHLHSHRCKGESTPFNVEKRFSFFNAIVQLKGSNITILTSFRSFLLSDLFSFRSSKFLSFHQRLTD